MLFNLPAVVLLPILWFGTALSFDINSKSNVAVYWGQNSYQTQQDLYTTCSSDSVDIVILSFLYSFPTTLSLDFSSACTDTFSSGLLHCSNVGQDIAKCQKAGKKVLLSLGGAIGQYGFSSDQEAETFADTLWNKFGGGSDNERPFDGAIVDGFDFDIENHLQTGYPALVSSLRSKFSQDSSKDYYISAAPQCVYPDQSVGQILENSYVDFAFIQFYNNYCSLGASFNWDTWADYAQNTSPNKNIKLYIGLPGSASSAGSGYVDPSTAQPYIDKVKSSPNFGGLSFWDASSVMNNNVNGQPFVQSMKNTLGGSSNKKREVKREAQFVPTTLQTVTRA